MQIEDLCLTKTIISEKDILDRISFTLILQYIKKLQDEKRVYFLTEYIRGKELS